METEFFEPLPRVGKLSTRSILWFYDKRSGSTPGALCICWGSSANLFMGWMPRKVAGWHGQLGPDSSPPCKQFDQATAAYFCLVWPGQRWQIVGTCCAVGLVLVSILVERSLSAQEPASVIRIMWSRFAGKKGAGPFKGLVFKLCGLNPEPQSRILNQKIAFAEPGATTNGKGH